MKTLQIDEKDARLLYPTASAEFKQMLIDSFGKDFFEQKITDKIKTIDDVLADNGITRQQFDERTQYDDIDDKAFKMAKLIAKALNEGWIADYSDENQRKWFPWMRWDKNLGRFVFDYSGYNCANTSAGCGPRLCFKSKELCEYAAKTFPEVYDEISKHYYK